MNQAINYKELNKKELYFVSILPLLNMSYKLLTRKNNGKKPFSNEFQFEFKIKLIENSYHQIISFINDKKEVDLFILKEISSSLLLATKEIKIESLINDFNYLSNQIKETINVINKL